MTRKEEKRRNKLSYNDLDKVVGGVGFNMSGVSYNDASGAYGVGIKGTVTVNGHSVSSVISKINTGVSWYDNGRTVYSGTTVVIDVSKSAMANAGFTSNDMGKLWTDKKALDSNGHFVKFNKLA